MGETLERWLDREAVARRISTKPQNVSRLQAKGKLPLPSMHLGPNSPRWDINAIDAMMLEAKGASTSRSMEQSVAEICEDIRESSRRKSRTKATC